MGLANVIGGIVVLAVGLLITFSASRLTYMSEFGPGPGLLPLWIGIALSACACAVIVKAVRRLRVTHERFFQPKTQEVGFILATLIVSFLLLPLTGLSLGLALFTGFTMRVTGRHGWVLCVLMAVATALAVRIIFGYVLDIPLPKGLTGI
jgi:putative tricarboxylic transport membrane protein